ncbi:MAG: Uma2 family endonuclease [Caldilineaceae bacterium]|nr:Uma2 family endonuclease [Caldilineaceae bacterium]
MSEKMKESAVAYRVRTAIEWIEGERPLPPLENGDRLSREEFERRYEAMSHLKKAELIKGVVYMASPVLLPTHAQPHARIITLLGNYAFATPGVNIADNGSVRIDDDNEPQPDACLWIDISGKGQAYVDKDGYLSGAPELVIEIAASSASYDLHDKLEVYRYSGVREYGVWLTYRREFYWFRLAGDDYQAVLPDEKGIIASTAFPGLCLNLKALLTDDMTWAMADLQAGLQSDEHRDFVEWLAADDKTSE